MITSTENVTKNLRKMSTNLTIPVYSRFKSFLIIELRKILPEVNFVEIDPSGTVLP